MDQKELVELEKKVKKKANIRVAAEYYHMRVDENNKCQCLFCGKFDMKLFEKSRCDPSVGNYYCDSCHQAGDVTQLVGKFSGHTREQVALNLANYFSIEYGVRPLYCSGFYSKFPRNRIIFGAPGTGKSFLLEKERKNLTADDSNYERVTFHPDYTYANFVGTYKPVMACVGNSSTSEISYEYVPGPFMRVYVSALKSARSGNPEPYLLIIEEINRADPAAVFGDIFQLLDRGGDNVSEYPIQASEDVKKYLAKELCGSPDYYASIRIPDNMFIWASMNSADQGVFPMDTAFKRRWNFKYIGIDESDGDIRGKFVTLEMPDKRKVRFEWNELRKAINNFLAKEKINEDKQLGPYFIPRSIVVPAGGGNEIDSKDFCDVFKHMVIMYLFEDAAKQKRAKVFAGCKEDANRYSKICERFDIEFLGIFNNAIQNDAHAKYTTESVPASPGNGGGEEQTS